MATARAARLGIRKQYPFIVGGRAVMGESFIDVSDKYTGETAARVSIADRSAILDAIDEAHTHEKTMKQLRPYERRDILMNCVSQIEARRDEIKGALILEAGKPLRDAEAEIGRAIDTFTTAAEESTRQSGEYLPLEISARNKGFTSIVRDFPIGLVSMISPFNFPFNLVAHKVAPALAAGCPFVLKPSPRTPITSVLMGEILIKSGMPEGAFSILPCAESDSALFSSDDRIKVVSFTGSPKVGWYVKNNCGGHKKVLLELGGNTAVIVDKDADLDRAAERILFGAFYYAGQSCISVQVYDDLKARLSRGCGVLNAQRGDLELPSTFIAPLIAESEAVRVEQMVQRAIHSGGRIVSGGKRDGAFFELTILEDVQPSEDVIAEEVFGPVCTLQRFSSFSEAVDMVNSSQFGLQSGVFTRDINKAFYAYNNLEVGGVVINEIPSARVDSQPYGGIKASGIGREGLRYAIKEFSEPKIMLMKDLGESVE